MDMGSWGMGAPVEMEFAVTMSVPPAQPKEFALLQLRPLGSARISDPLEIEDVAKDRLICRSTQVLGPRSQQRYLRYRVRGCGTVRPGQEQRGGL